jgi:hypothetical protein
MSQNPPPCRQLAIIRYPHYRDGYMLTHENQHALNQSAPYFRRRNPKQKESNGQFHKGDGPQIYGLRDEVELEAISKLLCRNLINVSARSIFHLGDYDALAGDSLRCIRHYWNLLRRRTYQGHGNQHHPIVPSEVSNDT